MDTIAEEARAGHDQHGHHGERLPHRRHPRQQQEGLSSSRATTTCPP